MLNLPQFCLPLLRRTNLQSNINLTFARHANGTAIGTQAWSIGNEPRKKTVAVREKTKWLGFLVPLGSFVHERDVFFRQKGLRFHPGLNAALDPRDNAIYALRDGIIAISTERFIADTNNETVSKHYVDYEGPMMIRYAHVIPYEQPKIFKLTKLV